MYYVETKIKFRVEHEENAKELWWLREAIEQYLEGQEEIVFIDFSSFSCNDFTLASSSTRFEISRFQP